MASPPLAGLRVVVTRAAHQTEGLVAALLRAGARVELLPLLLILPPEDPAPLAQATARLRDFDWVVFTSSNAVAALLQELGTEWPPEVAVAAIGPATAMALASRGVRPALVASRPRAEGVLAELLPRIRPAQRVLLPQAADARAGLAEGLRAAGVAVEAAVAYRQVTPADAASRAAALFGDAALGWATFTSPSTCRAFAGLFGTAWERRRTTLRAASIGPVTSDALRGLGVPPATEAVEPSEAGLVAAIEIAVGSGVAR